MGVMGWEMENFQKKFFIIQNIYQSHKGKIKGVLWFSRCLIVIPWGEKKWPGTTLKLTNVEIKSNNNNNKKKQIERIFVVVVVVVMCQWMSVFDNFIFLFCFFFF